MTFFLFWSFTSLISAWLFVIYDFDEHGDLSCGSCVAIGRLLFIWVIWPMISQVKMCFQKKIHLH
jgi:hypothetical protein